jgi:peptidyl-tRNA hydrolase, PTH1 family
MYYIVGLGNPGSEYAHTRHNIGWLVVDAFLEKNNLPAAITERHVSGRVTQGEVNGVSVSILYPDTFMNHSGTAVRKLVPKGAEATLVVVYDDVDIPLGEVKVSFGRGSGGHNGVESIIKSLGTKDFIRVRAGIAKTGIWPWDKGEIKRPKGGGALERHVLGKFSSREAVALESALQRGVSAITTIIEAGHVAAMNHYN